MWMSILVSDDLELAGCEHIISLTDLPTLVQIYGGKSVETASTNTMTVTQEDEIFQPDNIFDKKGQKLRFVVHTSPNNIRYWEKLEDYFIRRAVFRKYVLLEYVSGYIETQKGYVLWQKFKHLTDV